LVFVSITGLSLLASTSSAVAEPAFSWVGQDGRTYFGSQPAKNAKSIKKLDTKPLSRYSTDKMLKRLGWDEERMEAQKAAEREAASASLDADKGLDNNGESEAELGTTIELQHEDVQISTNETGEITACSVKVNNNTKNSFSGISVAFELVDGTLVPGEGPDSLAATSSAEYVMPADLLPLSLESAKDTETSTSPVSKVLIHATPSKNP
jgi:hypothetical protein